MPTYAKICPGGRPPRRRILKGQLKVVYIREIGLEKGKAQII